MFVDRRIFDRVKDPLAPLDPVDSSDQPGVALTIGDQPVRLTAGHCFFGGVGAPWLVA